MTKASTDISAAQGGFKGWKRVVGGMLLAVSAGVAMTAWAAAPGGHPGHGHGMGFMAGDPARIDKGVDRLLASVNATEAQRTQIKQIVRTAAADLKGQRDASRQLREQAAQLFTAATVDANAVEALRQQMVAQHDQSSRRMSQALVEISRVLSPEQRQQLAAQMKKRAERMRDRHHGPRGEARPGSTPPPVTQ